MTKRAMIIWAIVAGVIAVALELGLVSYVVSYSVAKYCPQKP